jgi:hypothetical protein
MYAFERAKGRRYNYVALLRCRWTISKAYAKVPAGAESIVECYGHFPGLARPARVLEMGCPLKGASEEWMFGWSDSGL